MKKFIIEISPYPQQFIVTGENIEEAKSNARMRFYEKNNGVSIYETNVLDAEEI